MQNPERAESAESQVTVKLVSNHAHPADRMTVTALADADGVPALSLKVVVVESPAGPEVVARHGALKPEDLERAAGQPWALYERMGPDVDGRWIFYDTSMRVSPRPSDDLESRPVRTRPPM
jgi:hypothetical protein